MDKGLKGAWCKVALMKKVESLSAAVEDAEEEASSSSSGEKKQLNQRRETEETPAVARAPATEEEGASSTAGSLLDTHPVQTCRADGDKNKDETVSKVEQVIQGVTCLKEAFDFPEEPSITTFSRKSTAAFTSRGNTCRFLGSLAAGPAAGACGDEEAAEGRFQQVRNGVGNADGSAKVIRPATNQQEEEGLCKHSAVASGQKGPQEHWSETQWKKGATPESAAEDQTLVEETDGKDWSTLKSTDQSTHAATTRPVGEVCHEHHSVDATPTSLNHGTTLPTSHSRGSVSSPFAALQASSFRHSDSQCAALSQKVCASKHGGEDSLEDSVCQQNECRGAETKVEDETKEKSAFVADCWQIKRSASDGPSANFGVWRTDDDFRGKITTELDSNFSREETDVGRQSPPTPDCREGDCSTGPYSGGNSAVDRAGEQKWERKPPSATHAASQWDVPSRRDRKTCESPKRGDDHIVRSLSSLSRDVLTGRERRGNLEDEAIRGRGLRVGGFCCRSSPLRTESPPQEKRSGTTHGDPFFARAEWGRNGRRASTIGTERAIQATSPGSPGKKHICLNRRRSLLMSEEGGISKGGGFKTRVGTAIVPRGKEPDDRPHPLNTTRTYISSLSSPPNQEGYHKVPQADRPDNRNPQPSCEDDVEKPNDNVGCKIPTHISPASNWDSGRWDMMESNSTIFSAWSAGTDWEAAKTALPCTGAGGNSRLQGHTTGAEDDVYGERREAPLPRKPGSPEEESDGTRLVRELVEEFDKRRTNFSILVPKVLELVGVLMGRPAGTQLPCVFPRNFSPAASLRRPCPLPVCASFSEMGQTCTVEKLERYFPTFNIEGGLLLCTQGRRLESGGGGKYYFQDSRGHVIGCHKKHLARYDAQGRVASPVLLKTLLFCLVLKQVSRSKHASVEPAENQVFRLPAAANSGDAVSCRSPVLPAARISFPSCDSGPVPDSEQPQEARKGEATEPRAWRTEASPVGSPRLLRSLLDPLPPADALLSEARSSAQKEPSPGSTSAERGERPHELNSTSTSASSSQGGPSVVEELESPATKRKTVGGQDWGGTGESLLQGAKLTRRSGSCTSIPLYNQTLEQSTNTTSTGRLRRAVSTTLATFAKTNSSAEQIHRPCADTPISSLRGSPTAKREADTWECISDLRTSTRGTKQIDGIPARESTNTDRGQQPPSTMLFLKQQSGGSACTEGVGEESRVEPRRESRWCQDDEGDGLKSAGTASPALSSAASSASLAFHGSPSWWGGGETHSRRLGKYGTLSVVRSSNPQRLVRVYRSLVVEDRTHVVERLLRVWSMTLHARTSQSPHADKEMCPSSSPSTPEKVTEKTSPSKKNMEATVSAPSPTGLNEETDEKHLSVGEGETDEEPEDSVTPHTQEIDSLAADGGDSISQVQRRETRRGSLLGARDAAPGKAAYARAGERTTGSTVPETFHLRKSNTTECGRILRSVRTAERSLDDLFVGREDRRRQNQYECVADSANGRRLSRLRRASTSARGELKVERHLTRYRGTDETGQDNFMRSNKFVSLASPGNHLFGQPVLSRKRNDAGHSAGPCNVESVCEQMGEGDAFLWRPCMSVLWVKPLTVEQTMLKWSKSTPVFEPMEELAADRRGKRAPTAPAKYEGINPLGNQPLSMTLRSAPNRAEVFSTPTDTSKASYSEKRDGKKTPLFSSGSPDSVRSEPSTSADCTSSLPTSPLFAQASVMAGMGKVDQQQRPQQATMLTRLQAAPQAVEPSPTSMVLLQVIQQQILQLLQPGAGGSGEHATPSQVSSRPVQALPSKADRSSTSRTGVVSSNACGQGKELSLAMRLEKANGGPRRSNTWAAPESHSASGLLEDSAARSSIPEDFTAQKPGYERSPRFTAMSAKGRGMPRAATSELHYPTAESPAVRTAPLTLVRETENSNKTRMSSTRGFSGCPSVAADLTLQSHSTFENTFADEYSQMVEPSAAAAHEVDCAEAAAHFDEASPSSPGRSGGKLELLYERKGEDRVPAAMPAGGAWQHESRVRGEGGLTEGEMRRASQRLPPIPKNMSLQKLPEQHQNYGIPAGCKQAPPSSSKTLGSATDLAFTTGASKAVSCQESTHSGSDVDTLSLISRLLGLSVKAHNAEERSHTPSTQELNNAARGALAAQTAHALAALLSCPGDSAQAAKSDNGLEFEVSPRFVPSGSPAAGLGLPSDNGVDPARRSGQSSRKRGLDTVEVQKQEEREAEGWKKVTGLQALTATENSVERTRQDATEFLQDHCSTSGKKTSPFTQRQKKKTKWTALHSDEIPPEDMEAAEGLKHEQSSEAQEHVTDGLPQALTGSLTDATCKSEERGLTSSASWEQQNAHEGLLDLFFTQVLQHTSNATSAALKEQTE